MEYSLESLIHKIDLLNAYNPADGLPDSVFYFIGRNAPLINVDLLIRNPEGSILMTWRDDVHCGKGWHIPGGIIRFQEKIEDRIKKVALSELGFSVSNQNNFLEMNQIIVPGKKERSHFISMLYECELNINSFHIKENTQIKFFKKMPTDILKYHLIYEKYFT
jgi:ADP-ribose pyrophosphatase YjhB (NUDIX family)